MNNEVKDLISSLKVSLQGFTMGEIPVDDARKQYKALLARYNDIRSGIDADRGEKILKGICHHHNVENFSIFSGLYKITSSQIIPVFYCGEEYFNKRLCSVHNEILKSIETDTVSIISSESIKGLPHDIYTYPLFDSGTSLTVFISISSSQYFNERKFINAGSFLGDLAGKIYSGIKPLYLNYYTDIKHRIEHYARAAIDSGSHLDTHLFVCNMLEKIFIHMGMKSLLEISGYILQKLHENYGPESEVHALSLGEYLVLVKSRHDAASAAEKKRVEFSYKSITIPYQTLSLRIDSPEILSEFWQGVFSFTHYMRTGDIQK